MKEVVRKYELPRENDEGLPLTRMQLKVFRTYMRAFSHKETAARLDISIQTVKNHVANLYERLGVNTMLEAATKLGWLKPPDEVPTTCGTVIISICSLSYDHEGIHVGGFDGNL